MASIVCYDSNIMVLFVEVISTIFSRWYKANLNVSTSSPTSSSTTLDKWNRSHYGTTNQLHYQLHYPLDTLKGVTSSLQGQVEETVRSLSLKIKHTPVIDVGTDELLAVVLCARVIDSITHTLQLRILLKIKYMPTWSITIDGSQLHVEQMCLPTLLDQSKKLWIWDHQEVVSQFSCLFLKCFMVIHHQTVLCWEVLMYSYCYSFTWYQSLVLELRVLQIESPHYCCSSISICIASGWGEVVELDWKYFWAMLLCWRCRARNILVD